MSLQGHVKISFGALLLRTASNHPAAVDPTTPRHWAGEMLEVRLVGSATTPRTG